MAPSRQTADHLPLPPVPVSFQLEVTADDSHSDSNSDGDGGGDNEGAVQRTPPQQTVMLMPPPLHAPATPNSSSVLLSQTLAATLIISPSVSIQPSTCNSADLFPMIGGPQRVSSSISTRSTAPTIRRKVILQPGHSPLDWAKLKSSGKDLRNGIVQLQRFTLEDLALHKSRTDMWMAFRGKVYDVTCYSQFHPGGVPQLMRGAGKDATDLFFKVHPWINVDMVLDKCWIGYLISS
ncbi:hypothetical protein BSLG_000259 [Batrachochytrium salamandrivorans]|nr:hypothetical protein BSLG_000259 [Batrachochytrium salamandrivorans]